MKKLFLLPIIVTIFIFVLFVYLNSAPNFMNEETLIIKNGETLQSVAKNLKNKNLIRNVKFFKILSYLRLKQHVKTGEYKIYKSMTSSDIFNKLASGKVLIAKITIPEGFNLFQIAERLGKKRITSKSKFLYYAFDKSFLSSMKIDAQSAEGYLFPDTYTMQLGSDPRDVITKMHKKLLKVLARIRFRNFKKLHTILTVASLIEKEAKIKSEMKYISSVFNNRIEIGMRMDCDPTVRYAVKKFKGPITISDLKYDSPFNTYVVRGLPPTPICSPGKDAIIAAIYPKNTPFLYFAARKDGSHYFSRALREHNRAVKYFLRGGNKTHKDFFLEKQRLH